MQVSTAEFKKGLRIVFDGQPYAIVDFQHVKPGKGGAFVRTKLKHMRLGKVIDNTFRSGEKVELVDSEKKHMQFLYKDDGYHFMDTETYEQVSLSPDEVGDARDWLKENTVVDVLYIEGRPVAVELPDFVDLAVAQHEPGVRVQRPTAAPTQKTPASATSEESVATPLATEAVPSGLVSVEAPMVGTFYRAPSPSAEPYVSEGTVVKEGQILCIIEAMKLMNEIESKVGGRIVKIFVESGHAVEYGQPLFLIDPAR